MAAYQFVHPDPLIMRHMIVSLRAFISRRPPAALAPALSQMEIGFEPIRVCVGLTMLWITGGGCVRACARENARAREYACVNACVVSACGRAVRRARTVL